MWYFWRGGGGGGRGLAGGLGEVERVGLTIKHLTLHAYYRKQMDKQITLVIFLLHVQFNADLLDSNVYEPMFFIPAI